MTEIPKENPLGVPATPTSIRKFMELAGQLAEYGDTEIDDKITWSTATFKLTSNQKIWISKPSDNEYVSLIVSLIETDQVNRITTDRAYTLTQEGTFMINTSLEKVDEQKEPDEMVKADDEAISKYIAKLRASLQLADEMGLNDLSEIEILDIISLLSSIDPELHLTPNE